MKTNDTQFDDALKQLARSLRTTAGTDARPIARRHARRRVLKDLRRVRALLDEKAPAIIQRGEVKRRTPEGRIKLLERTGWSEVDVVQAARFAAAGVRIKRITWTVKTETERKAIYVNGKGWVKQAPTSTRTVKSVYSFRGGRAPSVSIRPSSALRRRTRCCAGAWSPRRCCRSQPRDQTQRRRTWTREEIKVAKGTKITRVSRQTQTIDVRPGDGC